MSQLSTGPTNRPAALPPFAFVLTASICVIGSNSLVLAPILPDVAQSFEASASAVMRASATFGFGTAASATLLGRLIDRHGGQRMLVVAMMLLAIGLGGSALAPTLAALVVAQLIVGIAAGVALPSIYTLAAIVAPAGRESETIGLVLTGWTLSLVAGVPASAFIANLAGWRVVYLVVASAALVACAFIKRAKLTGETSADTPSSPIAALRISGVAPLLGACAVFMGSFYGVYAYVGDHLHSALGRSLSANGLVAVAYGLGFGGAALTDRVIGRFSPGKLLPLIFIVCAGIYLAMAAASVSYAAMLAVTFFWGIVNHLGVNILISRLTALASGRRGVVMGLYSGVTYLALFAGTIGFGVLYAMFGFSALPLIAAALVLAAASLARMAPRTEGAE